MIFFGIDPGKTGAVAVLRGTNLAVWDFPAVAKFPDAFKKLYLEKDEVPSGIFLENVHSMRGQGVVSTFNFGEAFGWWKGFLAGYEVTLVSPQSWMKILGLKRGEGKKPSLEYIRGNPALQRLTPLEKHHNRADALSILIAGMKSRSYEHTITSYALCSESDIGENGLLMPPIKFWTSYVN